MKLDDVDYKSNKSSIIDDYIYFGKNFDTILI